MVCVSGRGSSGDEKLPLIWHKSNCSKHFISTESVSVPLPGSHLEGYSLFLGHQKNGGGLQSCEYCSLFERVSFSYHCSLNNKVLAPSQVCCQVFWHWRWLCSTSFHHWLCSEGLFVPYSADLSCSSCCVCVCVCVSCAQFLFLVIVICFPCVLFSGLVHLCGLKPVRFPLCLSNYRMIFQW